MAVSRFDLQFLQRCDFVQVFGEELGLFKMTHGWNSYKQLVNLLTLLELFFFFFNTISKWFKVSKCYMSCTASLGGQKIHRFPQISTSSIPKFPLFSEIHHDPRPRPPEVGHHQDPLGISARARARPSGTLQGCCDSQRWGNGGRLWIAGLWRGDFFLGIPLRRYISIEFLWF